MQVHQLSQFVLGLMVGGGGLFILLISLRECLKNKTLPPHVRGPLLMAILAITIGAADLSRSFDWPHQESYRTSRIAWLSLLAPSICLVWTIILKRAEKKAKPEVGTSTLGEHTA